MNNASHNTSNSNQAENVLKDYLNKANKASRKTICVVPGDFYKALELDIIKHVLNDSSLINGFSTTEYDSLIRFNLDDQTTTRIMALYSDHAAGDINTMRNDAMELSAFIAHTCRLEDMLDSLGLELTNPGIYIGVRESTHITIELKVKSRDINTVLVNRLEEIVRKEQADRFRDDLDELIVWMKEMKKNDGRSNELQQLSDKLDTVVGYVKDIAGMCTRLVDYVIVPVVMKKSKKG